MDHKQAWDYLKAQVEYQLSFQKTSNLAMSGRPEFQPNGTANVKMLEWVTDEMNMLEKYFIVSQNHTPEPCPVTDEPFFSSAYHPTRGIVALYGVPQTGYLTTTPVETDGQMHVDVFVMYERDWDSEGYNYAKDKDFDDGWLMWERQHRMAIEDGEA